ncbi:MAG: DUF134 domain-containing protein [Peptococcaceae bacterium]|nr:DUF134 domain-containing protein [Peptococcaceae bacterium]
MPRPRKWRNVCCLPDNNRFGPLSGCAGSQEVIQMTVDEYETIRLIDVEGMNQEECAGHMNIARTTVQGIYLEARKKLARALVEGRVLHIEGGDYQLCDGQNSCCRKGGCHKHHAGHGRCGTTDGL